MTNAPAPSQRVTVTFSGEGMVVGTLPGDTLPGWLRVTAAPQTSSPATVEISAGTNIPGNYSTTLRFATGRADGSDVVFTDVPVSLQLVAAQAIYADLYGLVVGNSLSVNLNNGAPQSIFLYPTFNGQLGSVAAGSTYTLAVTTQPTGQTCTFGNGASTLSTVADTREGVRYRVTCNAALIPWAWMGGARTIGGEPVYGTRGTASTSNTPGARMPAAAAADANGNLWLFGGLGRGGYRNDLWRYDIATGAWTWVSGSTDLNARPSYGTLDVPAGSNVPGARRDAVAWVDGDGDFWLFGGFGVATPANLAGHLNDLWKYDVAAGVWTWMGGSDQLNAPATVNSPRARAQASIAKDTSDAVWMFGGVSQSDAMGDLWKFNPVLEEWSLVTSRPLYSPPVYGERGVPAAGNYPGSRMDSALWVDASGNVWLFGGNTRNDMWRYEPATDRWTWMHGSNGGGFSASDASPGVYGTPGASSDYMPSSRSVMGYWQDAAGNFWIFGGDGRVDRPSDLEVLNDLWKYTPATNTWSYLSGSKAAASPAVFGTQGVASTNNVPSGRKVRATWVDASGRLWMYGGTADHNFPEHLSDVWRADPQ